jgi:hypothetical protein
MIKIDRPRDEVDQLTIAYHQVKQTVIEFWENEHFVAELPSGQRVANENAAKVFITCLQDNDIQLRKI